MEGVRGNFACLTFETFVKGKSEGVERGGLVRKGGGRVILTVG